MIVTAPGLNLKADLHGVLKVRYPESQSLFDEISRHVKAIKAGTGDSTLTLNQLEPQAKKRKLDTSAEDATSWAETQNYADISFSIPQRKKLKLGIGRSPSQGLKGTNAGGEVELATKWSQVRDIFCLPVPEKSQAQYNFCLLLNGTDGALDQILWTVPETVPKPGVIEPASTASSEETYRSQMLSSINAALGKHKRAVVVPTEKEFASQIVQAHRKQEKAYHVKAFRGAKDGFLFFLSNGIFWGFRKPLQFYPFDTIDSVSYTSVLQRTFNLIVAFRTSSDSQPEEIEFSMLDQEDFAGIDAYIKKHQLQDASMAEQRRARRVNVNGAPAGEDGDQADGNDGEGELEKAAREAKELEDEEDDEEDDENFDPGSEGESEGEGTSDEEDDEAAAGDGGHPY